MGLGNGTVAQQVLREGPVAGFLTSTRTWCLYSGHAGPFGEWLNCCSLPPEPCANSQQASLSPAADGSFLPGPCGCCSQVDKVAYLDPAAQTATSKGSADWQPHCHCPVQILAHRAISLLDSDNMSKEGKTSKVPPLMTGRVGVTMTSGSQYGQRQLLGVLSVVQPHWAISATSQKPAHHKPSPVLSWE